MFFNYIKFGFKSGTRFSLAFIVTIGVISVGFSAVAKMESGVPKHADAQLVVPIADENGQTLRTGNNEYVVLRVGQLDSHFKQVMSKFRQAYEERDQSIDDRLDYEKMVDAIFGYDPELATLIRSSKAGDPMLSAPELEEALHSKTNDNVVNVIPIHGKEWLETPNRGILDPRHFVEIVNSSELKIIRSNVRQGFFDIPIETNFE